ncbi:MAG: RluA family pseudouridine synthase [Spirochaetaceae bacterium]
MDTDRLLYEDQCLVCVNKRPGELVEWNTGGERPLIEDVRSHFAEAGEHDFVGIVHRLDQPTSGAIVFARTASCLRILNTYLRTGRVGKTYWAVVDSPPPEPADTLEHYIYHKRELNKSYASEGPRKGAKKARLDYRLLARSDRYHLLEIELHTGRHHQIRAQLHRIGCHIKGDLKYGFPRSNPEGGIHLHARALTFPHPETDRTVSVTAPVPEDSLWQFFEQTVEN